MSSVTIGGQTFVKSGNGWIDKKTKQPAPEGLTTLLNNVAEEESPEGKRKRVRVDPGRPVIKLGSSEYVYDFNGKTWIDKKTKDPANPNFSRIIEGVFQGLDEWVGADGDIYDKSTLDAESLAKQKSEQAKSIVNNMGSTGQAGKQKVRKPTGGGQFAVPNIKINSPIIQMIEKLSVIDGYLKQRLANDMASSNRRIASAKEQAIEQPELQSNATPNTEEQKIDAEVEKTNKESQAILVAGAVAAGALIISQLDPVRETFNAVIGFAKGVYSFASSMAEVINTGLRNIVGTPESRGEQAPNATPTADASRSSSMSQAGSAGERPEDTTAFSGPGQTAGTGGQTASGPASAEEITTAFPGPTASSNTGGAASSPDATSVAAAAGPPPAAPTPDATANTSSRLGRAASGAASGFVRGGILGAAVGAVTGFFSPDEDAPTESAPAPQATRTSAPSAGATSNQSMARAAQLAAGQVGIGQDGIGGYLRQGGVALNPRFEAWCAAFVNSTLAQMGLKGATNVANSFQKWGDSVPVSSVQEGDIVILTRGKGPDVTGGHIGIATGVRQGNKVEIIAGNTSNKVKKYFVEDNSRNALQVRRYNPEKPYGAGAVGGAPLGAENPIAAAGNAIWDLSAGAMESIATILRAGLGPMTPTSGSQLSTVNDTMSGNISRAARERTAETAAARTQETASTTRSDPMNLNAPTGSSTVQNLPTSSDKAGVDFYLTRMGFRKLTYNQTALAGMRA
jgi:uncharacterized protein (TIGR02594 family)